MKWLLKKTSTLNYTRKQNIVLCMGQIHRFKCWKTTVIDRDLLIKHFPNCSDPEKQRLRIAVQTKILAARLLFLKRRTPVKGNFPIFGALQAVMSTATISTTALRLCVNLLKQWYVLPKLEKLFVIIQSISWVLVVRLLELEYTAALQKQCFGPPLHH